MPDELPAPDFFPSPNPQSAQISSISGISNDNQSAANIFLTGNKTGLHLLNIHNNRTTF
jgi:hypothetical protein